MRSDGKFDHELAGMGDPSFSFVDSISYAAWGQQGAVQAHQ